MLPDRTQLANWRGATFSRMAASPVVPNGLRLFLLRRAGVSVEACRIHPHVQFRNVNVIIGRGATVQSGVIFTGLGQIRVLPGAVVLRGAVLDTGSALSKELGLEIHRALTVEP